MAAKSMLANRRRLSLDVLAANKENDHRIKVWKTPNNEEIATKGDLRHKKDQDKPSLFVRRKAKANGLPKDEDRKKDRQIKTQTSVTLTWTEKYISWRFFIVLLLQSSMMVAIFLRNCLPMAIVCMTKPRSQASTSVSSKQPNQTNGAGDEAGTVGRQETVAENASFRLNMTNLKDTNYEFDWDSEVQGLVLTSIMFTTFTGPLLMTLVKNRLGGKLTLTICNVVSTLLTFLSPAAARISPYCLVAIRVVLGVSLGGNVPVIGDCVAWWAPQDEKLTMIALTFTGVNIGNVMASFVSGYLCLVPLDNGWPFVFYTFGALSFLWGLVWHFLSSQKPEEHPYISENEKQYIISHRVGMDSPSGGTKVKPPYRKILRSVPVVAFFVSGTCHIWSTNVLFTYLPVYFNKQLKFSVQDTGLLTSLTSLFRLFGSLFWAAVGNKLVSYITINKSRKVCIGIGFGLSGLMMIVVGFFDEAHKWGVLGLLLVVMVSQSVGSSIVTAIPLDMAPRFAGLLTGMYVSFGSFISISGPLITASITASGTPEEWRIVWIIMGCLFILGTAIFLVFGQATLQPWAQGKNAPLPHVVSPFVTMGRRFSTFLEAPPLSPVSPAKAGKFDFSLSYKTPTSSTVAHLASPTPDIYYIMNYETVVGNMPDAVGGSSVELEESFNSNDVSSQKESHEEQPRTVRKRAFSEFGLEVVRSAAIDVKTTDKHEREQNPFFQQLKITVGVESSTEDGSQRSNFEGTRNEGFEDTAVEQVFYSKDIQVSRL